MSKGDASQIKSGEEALLEPRRVAAAVVSAILPEPKMVVNVGSHQGEFLEPFLELFPNARGEWNEPQEGVDTGSITAAKKRLARFGDRVSYIVGCYGRDISKEECVPQGTDVIITDWMSINQNLDGMYKIYRIAGEKLPSGAVLVNLDHVSFGGPDWDREIKEASVGFRPKMDGPPIKFPEIRVPTVDEQLGAMRAAGFDAKVVWQSFNLVLFVGRKK